MKHCPDADRVARAALSAVVEPGSIKIAKQVARAGADATWQAIVRRDGRLDPDGVLARRAQGVDGSALLADAAARGVGYVCPGDAAWPRALDVMPSTLDAGADAVPPPFGLWVRGNGRLETCGWRAVALVGSRAASGYGSRVATDMAADLTTLGWTVVSGAAYGIDASAHRGALAMGGSTVAVLACGLHMAYPRAHRELLSRIAETGLVLSELAPGMEPMRSRFIARNRIIAGLTAGTVVVEAARRSGALNTAHWAAKLGREVMMVPGPVTSEQSTGCHVWIRENGAVLVTSADDVADTAGELGADTAPAPAVQERPLDRYDPDVRHVYERMPAVEPATVADLVAASGYTTAFVETSLQTLAADGLVSMVLGGWARDPAHV